MKAQEFTRRVDWKGYVVFFSITLTLALLSGTLSVFGQNTQTTKNKADQQLKSSARVNPSTLAMEFSLPLAGYPGRSGNSMPITLSYSSKVWNMMKVNFRQEGEQVSGQQNYNYLVRQSTDIAPIFSEKSTSGWTSDLGPVIILDEAELYNQWGNIYNSSNGSGGNNWQVGCSIIEVIGFVQDDSCPSGITWRIKELCYLEDGSHQEHIIDNCVPGQSGGGSGGPIGGDPSQQVIHKVYRLKVQMPDGSVKEFLKTDEICDSSEDPVNCYGDFGTYLSIDGSRMRLEINEDQGNEEIRSVLYFPDGSKYLFPVQGSQYAAADKFIDRNGNVTNFNQTTQKWSDTMGRELVSPLSNLPPQAGTVTYNAKGINNADIPYDIIWSELEDVFEDPQHTQLKYTGEDNCQSVVTNTTPISPALFHNQPTSVLDDQIEGTTRVIRKQRACASYFGGNGFTTFNPVVMAGIELPNGQKYDFKYNEYAEITKIQYPTGGYERFEYDFVEPIGYSADEVYKQSNRGVKRRYVSFDGTTETQVWNYASNGITITTTAPDGSRSERDIYHTENSAFGSSDPRNGMVKEERVYDASSNHLLRSRTLTDWEVTAPQGTGMLVPNGRDPRPVRTISIMFEGGQILATMSETDYETPGENNSNAPTDASYFARLNAIQSKSYHYLSLTSTEANDDYNDAIVDLKNKFHNSGQVASISQTDYSYSSSYRARGIIGLPTETRVRNAANPTDILAKSQVVYDGTDLITGETSTTWEDPNTTLRGNATTTRAWVKETDTWLETSVQYDNFGNLRKAWDLNGNLTETEYSATYNYAYPTKVITPAPDSGNTGHGTTEKSEATTTYDLNTGLTLTVTSLNDLTTSTDDQTIATEYDSTLRPIRSYPTNFTAPESRTEYGVPDSSGQYPANQRFVKVRKQIDATNWDEAITWFDGMGRTIKTQAKDSQGDVFTETQYDEIGRVKQTTNPYRVGDSVLWSKPRYDELGRTVESYAPAPDGQTGASLGVTSFSISTVSGFVGTVVTSTDASGRKSRSITNALGQLLRVDEATATGGTETADLGTLAEPNQPTYYNYSPQGKMVKVQQGKPGDASIQYRYFLYDSLGRLIRVRQPEQEVNGGLDQPDSITGNNQWTAAFTYDVLGNVLTATDANGTVITNTYDKASRIITKTYSGGANVGTTPPVEYFYDGKCNPDQTAACFTQQSPNYAKGKLTQVKSTVSETRYPEFDYLGRLKKMEQRTPVTGETLGNAPVRVSSYVYNFAGALIKETYPSGRVVQNEFEADGDLSRIYGKASHSTAIEQTYANSFTYTADGKIEKLKLGNQRWEWAKFNERLQVTELALGRGVTDASLWDLKYDYGELNTDGSVNTAKNTGNIAKQTLNFAGLANPLVQTYKYDSLYRLTEARETDGTGANAPQTWQENFTYDRFGNREHATYQKFTGETSIALNSLTNPTIDKNNNRIDSPYYDYDKNGNLTDDPEGRTFVFDGNNKQKFVVQNNQNVGEYFYDGEGKRVKKKVYEANGITVKEETVFVYSSGKLVAEYSTKTAPENPTTSYTATDQLGSPRVITNSLGEVVSRRDFMPFGEEAISNIGERPPNLKYGAIDSVRQKFTGYQKDDETGLDFAEARMYENRHGRFTAVDPLLASGKSGNPQTFNRYVYAGNNPIVRIDPTGTIWIMTPTRKGKDGTQLYKYKWIKGNKVPDGSTAVNFNGQEYTEYYSEKGKTWVSINRNRAGFTPIWRPSSTTSSAGGLNDNARALIDYVGKRAPGMMLIMHVFSIPVSLAAAPMTVPAVAGPMLFGIGGFTLGTGAAGLAAGSGSAPPDSPATEPTPSPTPSGTPTPSPTPGMYGPYYRSDTEATLNRILESNEIWGRPPRNTFSGGPFTPFPKIKAYQYPFEGAYEFYTPVRPDEHGRSSVVYWTQGSPGVRNVDEDTVAIPVRVTNTNCRCEGPAQ